MKEEEKIEKDILKQINDIFINPMKNRILYEKGLADMAGNPRCEFCGLVHTGGDCSFQDIYPVDNK